MAKKCLSYEMEIPKTATGCRYCGARFAKVHDTSIFGKIAGAFKGLFIGGIGFAILGAICDIPSGTASNAFITFGIIVGGIAGFLYGNVHEVISN